MIKGLQNLSFKIIALMAISEACNNVMSFRYPLGFFTWQSPNRVNYLLTFGSKDPSAIDASFC